MPCRKDRRVSIGRTRIGEATGTGTQVVRRRLDAERQDATSLNPYQLSEWRMPSVVEAKAVKKTCVECSKSQAPEERQHQVTTPSIRSSRADGFLHCCTSLSGRGPLRGPRDKYLCVQRREGKPTRAELNVW